MFPFLLLHLIFIAGFGEFQPTVSQPTTPEKHLQLKPGAPFKIALFADLHFGENPWTDWGPQHDSSSIKVMSDVLDQEHPDFVIYLGDVLTANNIIGNAKMYWDKAISPTRERGIPWASVFGNHDDAKFECSSYEKNLLPKPCCPAENTQVCSFEVTSRLELMKSETEGNGLSYSRTGPQELLPSVSNYVVQVSSAGDPQSPVAFLYFLDSGGGSYPGSISSAQVEWFKNKAQEINSDSRVPEMIFWHIPSKSYAEVAPKSQIDKPCVGSILFDNNSGGVATQEAENGIMELIGKRPSAKAIFVGHNHGFDWCCPNQKLWLCFARHTGYGGYGTWAKGSRIVEITEQPFSIKSWIRMEDGSVHSEVVLSS